MPFSQSALARVYIADAIKNSSASIRACWTIVFTAATVSALNPAIDVLKCELHIIATIVSTNLGSNPKECKNFNLRLLIDTLWPFFLYFATFIRFYLGGIRTFDIKYNEIFGVVNNEIMLAEKCGDRIRLSAAESRFRRIVSYNDELRHKIEVFWLLFQSLIVVSLAFEISSPPMFVLTYISLILLNAIYLTWSIWISNLAITSLEKEIFPEWHHDDEDDFQKGWAARRFRAALSGLRDREARQARRGLKSENLPNHAASWWAMNNYIFGILMILIFLIKGSPNIYLMLTLCSSNAILDFILTRNFYFPKFLKRYKASAGLQETAVLAACQPATPLRS